jgi:histidine triad (HIT) family protein
MSEYCFICDKHEGNIQTAGVMIYEDDYVYVGHIDRNGQPNYLGHIMIDLKRHVPTLAEMDLEEAKAFGVMMARVSNALKESEGAEHIYAVVSGNSVPHLHMHLIARYPDTPEEYWAPFAVYDAPNARMGHNEEVIELCKRLKSFLEMHPYE